MVLQTEINQTIKNAQITVDKYTYPVFIKDYKNKPELMGSSVIIELHDKFFLITASHLLIEVKKTNSPFIIGINGKYDSLEGDFIFSEHDEKDHFDIAFIELSKTFISRHSIDYLPETKITKASNPVHIAFVHGFPCSKNKQSKSLRKTKSFRLKSYAYSGILKTEFSEWDKFSKSKNLHICMTYNTTSDKKMPTSPKGLSGCGLWIIPNHNNPNGYLLSGIFIEYYPNEKISFSTRIEKVIQFIKSNA